MKLIKWIIKDNNRLKIIFNEFIDVKEKLEK